MRWHGPIILLLGILTIGWATPRSSSAQIPATQVPSSHACVPSRACCPAALRGFCRVGCPGPPPDVKSRVAPDLTALLRPLPSGVVILEVGINEKGLVVSACVLRGIRSDFDEAAQAAALRWRWNPYLLHGKPIGVVITITVCTPDLDCYPRARRSPGPSSQPAAGPRVPDSR
jgi:TonB family protein